MQGLFPLVMNTHYIASDDFRNAVVSRQHCVIRGSSLQQNAYFMTCVFTNLTRAL